MAPSFSTPMKFMSLSMLLTSIMMVYEAYGELTHQTTLMFYLQDITLGPNATGAIVTGIKGNEWSYTTFGTVFVVDDPISMSPNPRAISVGRAQGQLIASAHDGSNMNVALSIVFNNEMYHGSTLEVQGVIRQRENKKELSIVSGTGKFRFARGYVVLQTLFYDADTTHSINRLIFTVVQS